MSFPPHLIQVNSRYYFKVKVPVDLLHHFPRTFIKKSLRTSDLREAKTMLAAMEYNTHKNFTLLRTGMLPADVAQQVVQQIVPLVTEQRVRRQIEEQLMVEPVKVDTLSVVIKEYVNAKQHEWTEKSKMEFGCVLKLLQDILGDIEVKSITRAMVLELRSTLMKLPTNMYKKHPGKSIQEILSSEHTELLSIKSVNKHVSKLGAILR